MEQLRKHPCICYWTIFNEGWGQFDSQREYEFLKTLDDTRFVDTASGWFRWGDSDVESLHIYFHPIRLLKSQRPQVLSEFGGYVYKVQDHSFNRNKTYGYKLFDRQEDFMEALERLYREGVRRHLHPAFRRGGRDQRHYDLRPENLQGGREAHESFGPCLNGRIKKRGKGASFLSTLSIIP